MNWRVSDQENTKQIYIVDSSNRVVAGVFSPYDMSTASLISAAPDLLEGLQHCVHWFDQLKPDDIVRYKIAIAKAIS